MPSISCTRVGRRRRAYESPCASADGLGIDIALFDGRGGHAGIVKVDFDAS
jgi:hypothetical protein